MKLGAEKRAIKLESSFWSTHVEFTLKAQDLLERYGISSRLMDVFLLFALSSCTVVEIEAAQSDFGTPLLLLLFVAVFVLVSVVVVVVRAFFNASISCLLC